MRQFLILLMASLLTSIACESVGNVTGTNLTIRWSFPDSQHIAVQLEWRQSTYCALMFGDTMTNSDMWLCSLEKGMKNWTVSDQWSTGHKDPQNDTAVHGTDDLTNKTVVLANGTLTCTF